MPNPLSVDNFKGLKRRPKPDKIENGSHSQLEGVNLKESTIKGNRGRLKQNLNTVTDIGKNGLFYYENSDGVRQLVYADQNSLNTVNVNPIISGFFSYSTSLQLATGRAIDADSEKNVYLLELGTSNIKKYDKDGVLTDTFTIPSSFLGNAIRVEDNGVMYVSGDNTGTFKVFKLDTDGTELTSTGIGTQANYMAVRQGHLYINSGVDVEILSTDTLASVSTISGVGGETIQDMDFAENGKVYAIWDNGANRGIKEITDTSMTKIVTTTTDITGSLTVDEFNRIWVVFNPSSGVASVRVYNTDGNQIEEFFENGSNQTDFFITDTAHIQARVNELIIHDYNSGNFKGVKIFTMRKDS